MVPMLDATIDRALEAEEEEEVHEERDGRDGRDGEERCTSDLSVKMRPYVIFTMNNVHVDRRNAGGYNAVTDLG